MVDLKGDVLLAATQYADELARIVESTRRAVNESKASLGDRASMLSQLLSYPTTGGPLMSYVAGDPGLVKLARLAGARRFASEIYFRTQRDLLESEEIDKVAALDSMVAGRIFGAFQDLNAAIQDALKEETTWGQIPERIALVAMNEVFSGALKDVEKRLAQLLGMLQKIGNAAGNLVDAADDALSILEAVTKYALPIAIVIAVVWFGPKLWKSRPD